MLVSDAVVVVTGAGNGIGAALAGRFAAEGAAAVVVADLAADRAHAVCDSIGAVALPVGVDVGVEAQVRDLVTSTLARFGRIDLFCSNAGFATGIGLDAPAATWQRSWDVHVMSHVYAARTVLPSMIAAGGGYLLNTASAAGLLSSPGDAPYTVTKHAAVAFAEWIAYEYAAHNIGVSVLCPLGVDTALLSEGFGAESPAAKAVRASGPVISVELVADAVIAGLAEESFLILPHQEVARFYAGKAADPDRWLSRMAALAARTGATG
jgi:NAD(P)-dependent dehydrogenase (short-subunit alcohol dehydrogenase family)